jgi:hypothetical protein
MWMFVDKLMSILTVSCGAIHPQKRKRKNVSCDAQQVHCTAGDYSFLYSFVELQCDLMIVLTV